ncbi:MAG: segregation/condensation protein A [Patescibacteria group bacterium]
METDFKVQVGEFEGPLELLLELIEKRKLHINSVSLSKVAEDFLEHIEKQEEFPIADSADFILIASTLLLIKSKSLLPNLELTEEEEESIENLEERLREYQKYKILALNIQKMFGDFLFFAEESKSRQVVFAPTAEISTANLHKTILETLSNIPKQDFLPKVKVEKTINLEEIIENLSKRVQKSIKMSFSSFVNNSADKAGFSNKENRVEVIVSFLAMLELVKRGAMRVSQTTHFGDIEMENENLSVPVYN